MRSSALALLIGTALVGSGCGKKQQQSQPEAPPDKGQAEPNADPAAERNKQLAGLKTTRQETRRASIEELSWLAEDDPAVLPALVELLRDKSTAGAGKTLANQINSTREAAALAIMACTKGEAVMKEKGLAVLREGLTDPSPVIREHTAYTIGQLGPVARPLAPDVQKLCTDPDANVRGAAFDALRVTGVADPAALTKLLKHDNEEVVRLSAELIPLVAEMPAEAVAPLSEALGSTNSNVRAAAAEGLALAGPKAAPAAQPLADVIKKSYPEKFDPTAPTMRHEGPELSYWKALVKIGEPAVGPTAKLLEHPNPLVRAHAARVLGEIGPPAKVAADALKKALGDTYATVCVEAAVTLCKLGEAKDDALALVKKALETPTQNVAATAIEGIYRMGADGKPLVPQALTKLSDPNPYTRLAAVTLAGLLPPEEATKAAADVGKQATDAEPDIRRCVGRVLERLGPAGAPAADALGKALPNEKELDIRDQFVEALVAMGAGAKPALPGLLPLLTQKGLDASLRTRALAAVVAADPSSPEVAAALVKAAADDDQTVRAAAAAALGKLNPLPPDALATLQRMAKSDARNGPRVAALRAITAAGPRARAAKADLEAIAGGPQPGLALWAKVASAAIDGDVKRTAPTVRAGLADRNAQARSAAAEALLVIGPTDADLPILLKLMKDVVGTTRAASATAAGRLGASAKDAVPQLRRLLDDREVEVRVAAADALGQIGPAARPAMAKLNELLADPSVKLAAQRALDKIGTK
ncbi:MAG: HEAT repeat domain-containing protein [Planctomycetes bacterium]|nr:HEAT repeat domain-containing protein [Planctomycetota bacterium]